MTIAKGWLYGVHDIILPTVQTWKKKKQRLINATYGTAIPHSKVTTPIFQKHQEEETQVAMDSI